MCNCKRPCLPSCKCPCHKGTGILHAGEYVIPPPPETIVAAACKIPKGSWIIGRDHGQCIKDGYDRGVYTEKDPCRQEYQGFVTSSDRWVSREEAFVIAHTAGQIKKEVLLSEMIWMWAGIYKWDEEKRSYVKVVE